MVLTFIYAGLRHLDSAVLPKFLPERKPHPVVNTSRLETGSQRPRHEHLGFYAFRPPTFNPPSSPPHPNDRRPSARARGLPAVAPTRSPMAKNRRGNRRPRWAGVTCGPETRRSSLGGSAPPP